jgi:Ca2+/H+ antiporter
LIPINGNATEHSTAIIMAMKNKMSIAVEIAIGVQPVDHSLCCPGFNLSESLFYPYEYHI